MPLTLLRLFFISFLFLSSVQGQDVSYDSVERAQLAEIEFSAWLSDKQSNLLDKVFESSEASLKGPVKVFNHYYDFEDQLLKRLGIRIRLRQKESFVYLTVKDRGVDTDKKSPMKEKIEYELKIQFQNSSFAKEFINRQVSSKGTLDLRKLQLSMYAAGQPGFIAFAGEEQTHPREGFRVLGQRLVEAGIQTSFVNRVPSQGSSVTEVEKVILETKYLGEITLERETTYFKTSDGKVVQQKSVEVEMPESLKVNLFAELLELEKSGASKREVEDIKNQRKAEFSLKVAEFLASQMTVSPQTLLMQKADGKTSMAYKLFHLPFGKLKEAQQIKGPIKKLPNQCRGALLFL